MKEIFIFETERLYARRLTVDDAPDMLKIFGDRESMTYVDTGEPMTESACIHWVEVVTAANYEKRGYGLLGLFDKRSGAMVACAGVFHPNQQLEPEIMYYVERSCWGQGFATELVIKLTAYAMDVLGIRTLIATISPEHLASQRVMAKAGYRNQCERISVDGDVEQVWELSNCCPP